MNIVAVVMAVFAVVGAIDRIIGNRFGIGKEFEKGINMMGPIMLSMTGMIVMAPAIAELMKPLLYGMAELLPIDPSIIPATLFANDMGGAPLAVEVAQNADIGNFNALVVSAMMGATISFTIPVALGMVDKSQHKDVLTGLMCGIITIPLGCAVSGFILRLPFDKLLWDLLPLTVFSLIIVLGLLKCPDLCVKIFSIFGQGINILITVGLAFGILKFLTGVEIIKGLAPIEEGAAVCLNASCVMAGAFPLINILSRVFAKPLKALGNALHINETASTGIFSSMATSMTTFGNMKDMDQKGVVLNSAFAVSGAFVFAGHLAFTLAFNDSYVFCVIVGKLVAGVLAMVVANWIYARLNKNN